MSLADERTIEELMRDLDEARDAYHTATNERQRMVREKRLYSALARLSDKCVQAERWLDEHFTTGRDETWLAVLAKYQNGAKSLERGARRSLPAPSSSPAPATLPSKFPNSTDRYPNSAPVLTIG